MQSPFSIIGFLFNVYTTSFHRLHYGIRFIYISQLQEYRYSMLCCRKFLGWVPKRIFILELRPSFNGVRLAVFKQNQATIAVYVTDRGTLVSLRSILGWPRIGQFCMQCCIRNIGAFFVWVVKETLNYSIFCPHLDRLLVVQYPCYYTLISKPLDSTMWGKISIANMAERLSFFLYYFFFRIGHARDLLKRTFLLFVVRVCLCVCV